MKRILLIFNLLLFFGSLIMAQAPKSFQYQAIARDASGNILVNKELSLKISLLEGSQDGPVVYCETHSLSTNAFGLVNVRIGGGKAINGSMSDVMWGASPHFISLDMDINGGADFKPMGTSELLSVPYALYAEDGPSSMRAGEWNNDGTNVYLDEGNFPAANVGIGTNAPAYKLDVNGEMFAKAMLTENNSSLTTGRAVLNSLIGTYDPASSSSLNATTFQTKCQTEDGTMAVNNTNQIQAMKFSFVHKNNGTINELMGVRAQGGMPSGGWGGSGTTGTITSLKGFDVELWAEKGTITYGTGITLEKIGSNITNTTFLRIDQSTDVAGNFGIYNNSTYDNYFAGNMGIGLTNPSYELDVDGHVNATGFYLNGSYMKSGIWGKMGDNAIYDSGNVGIGTSSANEQLHVYGRVYIENSTAPASVNNRLYSVGGNLYWSGHLVTRTIADDQTLLDVYNEGGNDVLLDSRAGDIRFYNASREALYIDYTNARVGMGTTTPNANANLSVYNSDSDNGNHYGIFSSFSTSSEFCFAVYGIAEGVGSKRNIGIYGSADRGQDNYAGFFDDGDVYIKEKLDVDGTAYIDLLNMDGHIDMDNNRITELAYPVIGTDAASKAYVDANSGDNLGNHSATQDLDMNGRYITELPTPTDGAHAATKAYVDSYSGSDTDWNVLSDNVYTGTGGTYPSGNVGIGITNPSAAKLEITNTGGLPGIKVNNPGHNGIWVESPAVNGLYVNAPDYHGVAVTNATLSGAYIEDAGDYGIMVKTPVKSGIRIDTAGYWGIQIQGAGFSGIKINETNCHGVDIYSTGHGTGTTNHGVQITQAGGHGVYATNVNADGFNADDPDGYGLYVESTGDDGVYADSDNSNWGVNTPDNIQCYSISTSTDRTICYNSGNSSLKKGDIVSISGGTTLVNLGSDTWEVVNACRSNAENKEAVLGVVESLMILEPNGQNKDTYSFHPADGQADGGTYFSVTTKGLAEINIERNNTISIGQKIGLEEDNNQLRISPYVDQSMVCIGKAVTKPENGRMKIYVSCW